MAIELDPRSLPSIEVVRVEETPPAVYGALGGREIPLTASLPEVHYEVHVGPHSFPIVGMIIKYGDWMRIIAANIPDASILSSRLRGCSGALYIQETYNYSDDSPARVLADVSYFFHPDSDPTPTLAFRDKHSNITAADCFIRDLAAYVHRYFCKRSI